MIKSGIELIIKIIHIHKADSAIRDEKKFLASFRKSSQ